MSTQNRRLQPRQSRLHRLVGAQSLSSGQGTLDAGSTAVADIPDTVYDTVVAINPENCVVTAEEVPRGLACQCRCIGCDAAVLARQGEKKRWHFAHQSRDCEHSAVKGALRVAEENLVRHLKQFRAPRALVLPADLVTAVSGIDTERLLAEHLPCLDWPYIRTVERLPDDPEVHIAVFRLYDAASRPVTLLAIHVSRRGLSEKTCAALTTEELPIIQARIGLREDTARPYHARRSLDELELLFGDFRLLWVPGYERITAAVQTMQWELEAKREAEEVERARLAQLEAAQHALRLLQRQRVELDRNLTYAYVGNRLRFAGDVAARVEGRCPSCGREVRSVRPGGVGHQIFLHDDLEAPCTNYVKPMQRAYALQTLRSGLERKVRESESIDWPPTHPNHPCSFSTEPWPIHIEAVKVDPECKARTLVQTCPGHPDIVVGIDGIEANGFSPKERADMAEAGYALMQVRVIAPRENGRLSLEDPKYLWHPAERDVLAAIAEDDRRDRERRAGAKRLPETEAKTALRSLIGRRLEYPPDFSEGRLSVVAYVSPAGRMTTSDLGELAVDLPLQRRVLYRLESCLIETDTLGLCVLSGFLALDEAGIVEAVWSLSEEHDAAHWEAARHNRRVR